MTPILPTPHCTGRATEKCQRVCSEFQGVDSPGLAASLILRLMEVMGG